MTLIGTRTFVGALFALVFMTGSAFAQLPASWASRDIGSVGAAGAASGASGSFSLDGAGADVWGTADAFRFAYTQMTGDGSIVARVSSVQNVDTWTKAGVMMRESLNANSRHAFMLASPVKGLAFQRRTSTGGSSYHTAGASSTAPAYVKLTRTGSTIRGYQSSNGSTWTLVGSATVSMTSTIYVGVAVTSHVAGVLANAAFDQTAVTPAAPAAPDPPSSTTGSSTLRVLHWNVHHGGVGTDGKYDPARIATWIATMKPDIASLNEVDTKAQVDAIVNALQSKTGVTWNVSFSGKGNLVISRLPINSTSKCLYAPSYGSSAAHASVVVNGRAINLWATHLHSSSASSRLSETKLMQECAQQWAEARILAGDYNMQYGSTEYKQSVVGYSDAWLVAKSLGAATNYSGNCDGCTRNSRIDYVFTSTGASFLKLKSAQVYDTRDAKGKMPSDHKPLLVVYTVD